MKGMVMSDCENIVGKDLTSSFSLLAGNKCIRHGDQLRAHRSLLAQAAQLENVIAVHDANGFAIVVMMFDGLKINTQVRKILCELYGFFSDELGSRVTRVSAFTMHTEHGVALIEVVAQMPLHPVIPQVISTASPATATIVLFCSSARIYQCAFISSDGLATEAQRLHFTASDFEWVTSGDIPRY